jgi:hypothetical protein
VEKADHNYSTVEAVFPIALLLMKSYPKETPNQLANPFLHQQFLPLHF